MKIPIEQFTKEFTSVDGEKATVIFQPASNGAAQCPKCLCILSTTRRMDDPDYPKFVELEWPCPHCERTEQENKST